MAPGISLCWSIKKRNIALQCTLMNYRQCKKGKEVKKNKKMDKSPVFRYDRAFNAKGTHYIRTV